jgi:hypothetical protein
MLRGKPAVRALLVAVGAGLGAGVIAAVTHPVSAAGDGWIVFCGVIIGARVVLRR